LRIISANILFEDKTELVHPWDKRLPILTDIVNSYSPAILATQEGREPQLRQIEESLDNFSIIESHRSWISERMYPSLFIDQNIIKVQASGDIWLSETPHVAGSNSFKSKFPRLATWLHGENKSTNKKFLIINLHIDHLNSETRVLQVNVLIEEIGKLNIKDPIILCGDFNEGVDGEVRTLINTKLSLLDPWIELKNPEEASFHKFQKDIDYAKRIDWILIDKTLTANSINYDKSHIDNIYPSDHYPVLCELK
jgi:endonuclease/exonuclease/phosphatase family metal-dependent hydrolase